MKAHLHDMPRRQAAAWDLYLEHDEAVRTKLCALHDALEALTACPEVERVKRLDAAAAALYAVEDQKTLADLAAMDHAVLVEAELNHHREAAQRQHGAPVPRRV